MNLEDIKIEKLKQKINRFNGLMEEISREFTIIYHEGGEQVFHDIVLDMMRSLEKSQEMVKKVYNLVLGKDKKD